jgi:hypothetical protein
MSPCNCGKSKNQVWVFTSRDGKTVHEYKTEIEARARVIRDGGGRITAKAI